MASNCTNMFRRWGVWGGSPNTVYRNIVPHCENDTSAIQYEWRVEGMKVALCTWFRIFAGGNHL